MIKRRVKNSRGYAHPVEFRQATVRLAKRYGVHTAVLTAGVPQTSVYRWLKEPRLLEQ